jgi:hypothetical protein
LLSSVLTLESTAKVIGPFDVVSVLHLHIGHVRRKYYKRLEYLARLFRPRITRRKTKFLVIEPSKTELRTHERLRKPS